MTLAARFKLAACRLADNPRRTALSIAGIGFAVLLICMQVGFLTVAFWRIMPHQFPLPTFMAIFRPLPKTVLSVPRNHGR